MLEASPVHSQEMENTKNPHYSIVTEVVLVKEIKILSLFLNCSCAMRKFALRVSSLPSRSITFKFLVPSLIKEYLMFQHATSSFTVCNTEYSKTSGRIGILF